MDFHKLELEDAQWIMPLLKASDFGGCDYAFANAYIWKDRYQTQVCHVAGCLCGRSIEPESGKPVYLFPAGQGDVKEAIRFMQKDAAALGEKFCLRGFTEKEAVWLEQEFPGTFHISSPKDQWDYLYLVEDLIHLAGKKYHGKRNHISFFLNQGDWRYAPLTSENKADAYRMCATWYEEQRNHGNLGAFADRDVVENAFLYYEQLGLMGGVLYQSDHVVAFTMGEPINSNTFGVHIEKAFADVRGAYPMINREFARHAMAGFTYVNREEDDGLEGLKKAKESYYPVAMVEKCVAIEK